MANPVNDGTKSFLKAVAQEVGCNQTDVERVAIEKLGKFTQAVWDVRERVRQFELEDAEEDDDEEEDDDDE